MVVECDEKTCKSNDDGYCEASWLSTEDQECITYDYDHEKEDEE